MALTPKMKAFCDAYIANGGNATQAAIEAGYSKKTAYATGHENLRKPQIIEYIRTRTEEAEAKRVAKGDEVLKYLTEVMRGEDSEHAVLLGGDSAGEVVGYVDQKNRIKAAELLAKYHGLMTQNVNHSGDLSVTFVDDLEEDDGG